MRVLGTRVHLELAVHGAAQRALRQHALDGGLDDTLRVALKRLGQSFGLQVADVASETVIQLVLQLVAVTTIFSALMTTR